MRVVREILRVLTARALRTGSVLRQRVRRLVAGRVLGRRGRGLLRMVLLRLLHRTRGSRMLEMVRRWTLLRVVRMLLHEWRWLVEALKRQRDKQSGKHQHSQQVATRLLFGRVERD